MRIKTYMVEFRVYRVRYKLPFWLLATAVSSSRQLLSTVDINSSNGVIIFSDGCLIRLSTSVQHWCFASRAHWISFSTQEISKNKIARSALSWPNRNLLARKKNELSLIFIICMYTFYTACREQHYLHDFIYVHLLHNMLSYKFPMSHEISAGRTSTTLVLTTKQNCHSLSSPPSYHIFKEEGYYEDDSAQRHHCYQLLNTNAYTISLIVKVVLHYINLLGDAWWICSFFHERKIRRIFTHVLKSKTLYLPTTYA